MISNPNIANTRYFCEAAVDYKKNQGRYTKAPIASKEWVEYWREQKRRCLEGYQVAGIKITGRHYYFLNFTRMEVAVQGTGTKSKFGSAPMDFPKFLEVQYNWWWAKEISRKGIERDEFEQLGLIWRPKQLEGGKHISCAKTRGCGFSYMEAADGTYNYNFIPDSKTFYFAAIEKYLQGDGILSKCWNNMDWLNQHTDGFWRKNRQEKDTLWQKKSSVKVNGDVKGFKSQIFGLIVDDPNKVRGNRGEKLTFEEAGSFKNLKESLVIARPLVEQGAITRGQISVFGTGGETGADIEGLESVFYEPEQYNMISFDNIWEEEGMDSEIGFFVPSFVCTDGFVNEDGIPDIDGSKLYWEAERAIRKKAKDFKLLDKMIAERPFTPTECFKRVHSNVFQDVLYFVGEQTRNIEHNKDVKQNIQHGTLMDLGKGWEFQIRNNARPLFKYPHKNDDDLDGCLSIYEEPFKIDSSIPHGLYTTIVDPFAVDDAEDKTSLGGIYVIKHNFPGCGDGNKIVASWVSRPSTVREFCKRVVSVTEYYNSTIQSEIFGGGQGLLDYLRDQNKLYLAEFEPDYILQGKELGKNMRNRKYFMTVSEDMKKTGLLYFAEYLAQPRGLTADGRPILNVHLIYDLGLLQEIAKFVNDPKKNFDRISCMILAMYMFKEKTHTIEHTKEKSKSNFFKRRLFSNEPPSSYGDLDLSNEIAILNKDWRE